jgi:TadE-like protein
MRRRKQKGHAMLELAVSAAVMVSCLAGTFQFGYTFYIYNELVTAVGNGARYAAQRTYRAATGNDLARGDLAIRNMVVFGDSDPDPDARPVVPNLKPENIDVKWLKNGAGVPLAVDVSLHGYTLDAMFQSITMEGRPAVEFPFVGQYAPGEHQP